jgi:hypothetical protein
MSNWVYQLTPHEEAIAARVGWERQLPMLGQPERNRNYSEGDIWEAWQHMVCAASELAAARMMGLKDFEPHVNTFKNVLDIPGYEIEGSNKDTFKKKELVLTKDEVDDYSDQQVRDSFSVSNDEDEDYNTNDNDRGYKFEKKVAFKTGPSRMTGGYW